MIVPTDCRWSFPSPDLWPDDDDVVAVGADLETDTLLYAYAHGMFPMFNKRNLLWWSPVDRGVIPLDGVRITRSMRQSAKKFTCTINTAFVDVMKKCATTHTDGNWIDKNFIESYSELHLLGHAHSVEVWDETGELVGGLYGVRINKFFAGESMFHTETDASKVALMHLVQLMTLDGMELLDTQWRTEHLETLGCIAIPREKYLQLLASAVQP
ncbi:MAG: leucyl/phenylalanyl-tRNA--protein transferase [Actinomycetota bacterium]|jgi:leucyl/phenylalanyl-tRNA--protein transferase